MIEVIVFRHFYGRLSKLDLFRLLSVLFLRGNQISLLCKRSDFNMRFSFSSTQHSLLRALYGPDIVQQANNTVMINSHSSPHGLFTCPCSGQMIWEIEDLHVPLLDSFLSPFLHWLASSTFTKQRWTRHSACPLEFTVNEGDKNTSE